MKYYEVQGLQRRRASKDKIGYSPNLLMGSSFDLQKLHQREFEIVLVSALKIKITSLILLYSLHQVQDR